jgi:hypothetical protein
MSGDNNQVIGRRKYSRVYAIEIPQESIYRPPGTAITDEILQPVGIFFGCRESGEVIEGGAYKQYAIDIDYQQDDNNGKEYYFLSHEL